MRAVLVDNSALILEKFREFVNFCKLVEIVVLCDNGTKVLKAIQYLNPDLAINDIQMPGITCQEVLSAIYKDDKKLKIIILPFFHRHITKRL